jgi:hypothetical protein
VLLPHEEGAVSIAFLYNTKLYFFPNEAHLDHDGSKVMGKIIGKMMGNHLKTFRWLTAANMVKPVWKNQSSDFNLVDLYTSGVLNLVDWSKGLCSGVLILEP